MTQPEPQILRYQRWLAAERGLVFDASTRAGYEALWRWSIDDLRAFWGSIWDYHAIESPTPFTTVLVEPVMPGATLVSRARRSTTRARCCAMPTRRMPPAIRRIVFQDERGMEQGEAPRATSWPELRRRVAALARQLQALGIEPGDRVAAFLPNTPDTIVAFLACASIGAVWSVCSPDMGPVAVLDRFRQIEPKLLFAVGGYVHGGATHDRRAVLEQLLAELPSVRELVLVAGPVTAASTGPARGARLRRARAPATRPSSPRWLPFDHPLWIVYSSGTTGLPKAIVHGHGGVMLEALKAGLHNNLGPSVATGDRYHWYSSTGWIMWNSQPGALLGGSTVCIFDGSPAGKARRARLGHPVALRRRRGRDLLRRRRGVLRELPEGRRAAAARGRPVRAARHRLDRLAARRRVLRLDLAAPAEGGRRAHLARLRSAAAPISPAPSSPAW